MVTTRFGEKGAALRGVIFEASLAPEGAGQPEQQNPTAQCREPQKPAGVHRYLGEEGGEVVQPFWEQRKKQPLEDQHEPRRHQQCRH